MGAEFTATSMIGFIALAGIIVRNSILLVEFVKHEVASGNDIREAVIRAGMIRMRPIFITALTLIAGSAAIVSDLIFRGMAVSLLFGTAVATVLTLIVIPLGCISAEKQFRLMVSEVDDEQELQSQPAKQEYVPGNLPLWMRVWSLIAPVILWIIFTASKVYIFISAFISNLLQRFKGSNDDGPQGGGNVPGSGPGPGPKSGPEGGSASVTPASSNEKETTAEPVENTASTAEATKPEETVSVREKVAATVQTKKKVSKKTAGRKKPASKKKTVQARTTKKKTPDQKAPSAAKKKATRRGIRLKTD